MVAAVFGGIAGPCPRPDEMRPARQTFSAEMIVSARIEERPATDAAERMGDETNALTAPAAETIVGAEDGFAAEAAPRRIKPIQPTSEADIGQF